MAMQTTCPLPAPSAQVVGNAFVEHYYHILHQSPELVHRFYNDSSVLSRPDPNGLMTTVTTMKSINDKICSLDYNNYKAEIITADAQDSYKDGVVVLVTGFLTGNDNLRRKFSQTFFLAPQANGYYVKNDVFRYVEESEPDISEVTNGVGGSTLHSVTQDPEPVQVVDPPTSDYTASLEEEIETVEEKPVAQKVDEKQTSHDRDIVVEAKSHPDENYVSANAESDASAFEDDAPKKSYASIVSSQTKKGPTKVYVPASTARSVKPEKQTVILAAEALGSKASAPSPVGGPIRNNDQDEVDGHSIYISNLPLNATVAQLEAEFKKFGTIKQDGVQVRSNKYQGFCFGFVEFQDFISMQNAIKASPIMIGYRQATLEIKRTVTRGESYNNNNQAFITLGTGRGRFNSSHGGFRNDSFRACGNFSGGQTFVRNNSFRGRGNFSCGRNGDGNQQGRGRGPMGLEGKVVPCESPRKPSYSQIPVEDVKLENVLHEVNNGIFVVEGTSSLGPSDVKEAECLSKDLGEYPSRPPTITDRRKLLVLDVNGILAYIVMPAPKGHRGDITILRRAGIWSSRAKEVVDGVVDYLLGNLKQKLLFCWNMSHSTQTGFRTLENHHKPLVCKELRKIWENDGSEFSWKKGQYNESNTLLIDDSSYKALLNPLHTAIFPHSYHYEDKDDNSLGPGGDLRVYLEGLLKYENVQEYVEHHPFGQCAINEKSVTWQFYAGVLRKMSPQNPSNKTNFGTNFEPKPHCYTT